MDSTRKDADAIAELTPADLEPTPATPASRAFFDYEASTSPAPALAPRPMTLPVDTIGYYYRDLSNHGPICRFWSFDETTHLVSFVNWHALVQRPFEVLAAIKARGAPMRRLDASPSMQLQLTMWSHDLQAEALDAQILARLGAIIATPLPEGVLPPRLIATLRPEYTAPEWLEAISTADVHEQFAVQLQRAGLQLH